MASRRNVLHCSLDVLTRQKREAVVEARRSRQKRSTRRTERWRTQWWWLWRRHREREIEERKRECVRERSQFDVEKAMVIKRNRACRDAEMVAALLR
jgi:hypothetical protein